jgi:hypothetical protein
MSSRQFTRTCALMGLFIPAVWGFVSLLPQRSAVVFLAGSRTFELISVALWPGFLFAAVASVFGNPHPVIIYVAMSLINVGWYVIVGKLLLRAVVTIREWRGAGGDRRRGIPRNTLHANLTGLQF